MADNVLLSSALEEVESLKEMLEKSDEELLELGGKNEQLEEEVSKGRRDLVATMKAVEEFKVKLNRKEGDIGVLKDEMEEVRMCEEERCGVRGVKQSEDIGSID